MKAPKEPAPIADLSFEQAIEELDALVRRMEAGDLGLDDSISAYRRGAELARHCQERLAVAEKEIRRLDGEGLRALGDEELRGNET